MRLTQEFGLEAHQIIEDNEKLEFEGIKPKKFDKNEYYLPDSVNKAIQAYHEDLKETLLEKEDVYRQLEEALARVTELTVAVEDAKRDIPHVEGIVRDRDGVERMVEEYEQLTNEFVAQKERDDATIARLQQEIQMLQNQASQGDAEALQQQIDELRNDNEGLHAQNQQMDQELDQYAEEYNQLVGSVNQVMAWLETQLNEMGVDIAAIGA